MKKKREDEKASHSIGTEHESSLHRALKFRYAGAEGKTEQKIGGFVADGINGDGEYIEVQTGSFGPLRRKIKKLSLQGNVRIIHPVALAKIIEVFEPGDSKKQNTGGRAQALGKLLYRRKSPLKGSPWTLFESLLYAPELPLLPGLCIEIVLLDVTEKRLKDGKGSWRRKGMSILDREMFAWHESIVLRKPRDYLRFLPFKKNEQFTTALLAEKTGIKTSLARKTLYVLAKLGIIKKTGKNGNAWVYEIESKKDGKTRK